MAYEYIQKLDGLANNFFYVFTKIDLCDKQELERYKIFFTNLSKVNSKESGDSIPINGFTILKNRSEAQLSANENLALFLKKEKDYFRSIVQFRGISVSDCLGYDGLVEKIKKPIYKIIAEGIPNIYEEMKKRIAECQEEISKFGTEYIYLANDSESSKVSFLNTLVSQFADEIDAKFSGKLTKTSAKDNLTTASLKKLYYEFLEDYKNNSNENLPSKSMTNQEIIHIITVNEGDNISGFPQAEVIHSVLDKEMIKLKQIVKNFVDEVIDLIVTSIKLCVEIQFCRFPQLIDRVEEIINNFLEGVSR